MIIILIILFKLTLSLLDVGFSIHKHTYVKKKKWENLSKVITPLFWCLTKVVSKIDGLSLISQWNEKGKFRDEICNSVFIL